MHLCSQQTQLTKRCSKLTTQALGKGVTSKTSKHHEKSNSLFAGNKCPEPCPGQLLLKYTPIWVQKPAVNSYL